MNEPEFNLYLRGLAMALFGCGYGVATSTQEWHWFGAIFGGQLIFQGAAVSLSALSGWGNA